MKRISMSEFNDQVNLSGLYLSLHINTFSIPATFGLFDILYTNLYNEIRTQL